MTRQRKTGWRVSRRRWATADREWLAKFGKPMWTTLAKGELGTFFGVSFISGTVEKPYRAIAKDRKHKK